VKVASEVELCSPPDASAWDDLVGASPEATVFHTSAWAKLWTDEWKGARWEAIVVRDSSGYLGGIGAIVRRRGIFRTLESMPFGTYGGPIVRQGHPDPSAVRRLLVEAYAARAARRLTARSRITWYEGIRDEFPESLRPEESVTHVLPLSSDYERVAKGFSPSTRRLVRQADESGLSIRVAETAEDLRAFYEIAVETVRRRGGTPKPHSLYERILASLVPAGLARYHLVLHGESAVAGSLHLFHQGAAWSWLPVSRESSWHLRPNNYLIASLLETLCEAGYLEYNFGASPPGAAGLVRFKEGWGARPRSVLIAERRSALHRRLRS
jgi:CelD/BcsL family acetyltransferase involved in cellulose biosynthesis